MFYTGSINIQSARYLFWCSCWGSIHHRYLALDGPCPTGTCVLMGEGSGLENDCPADEEPLRLDKSWSAKNIAWNTQEENDEKNSTNYVVNKKKWTCIKHKKECFTIFIQERNKEIMINKRKYKYFILHKQDKYICFEKTVYMIQVYHAVIHYASIKVQHPTIFLEILVLNQYKETWFFLIISNSSLEKKVISHMMIYKYR